MSRSPCTIVLVAGIAVLGLSACDDGDSGKESKPLRSTTTTSSSSTSTSTVPGGATGTSSTTIPSGTTRPPSPESVGTCGNQTATLVEAIDAGVQGLDARRGQYSIMQCRLAASSPIWAAAEIVPNPGVAMDRATVVLQRIGALWNVEGTGASGCTNVPANVRTEIRLTCTG